LFLLVWHWASRQGTRGCKSRICRIFRLNDVGRPPWYIAVNCVQVNSRVYLQLATATWFENKEIWNIQ
jgi:hypothetical protein